MTTSRIHVKAALMQQQILLMLADGAMTTEEIRFACCDTYAVVYHCLRKLRKNGLLQSSKVVRGEMKRWRITPQTGR